MKSKIRKIACLSLTAVMASTFIAGNALAVMNNLPKAAQDTASVRYEAVKSENVTGKIDLTGVALQNLAPEVLKNEDVSGEAAVKITDHETYTIIASLDRESVVDSKGGSQTVQQYLNTFSGDRTADAIKKSQTAFLSAVEKAGISYEYVDGFNVLNNAVALRVRGSDIYKVRKLSGVKSVVLSSTYARPQEADTSAEKASAVTNPNDVYSTGIYNSADFVERGIDGSGVTIAVLDTGLDYTHEAFSIMPDEVALEYNDISEKMSELRALSLSASRGESITAEDVYINAKVPFAYDYADRDAEVYPSYSQHGVHVAGIAAGDSPSGYVDKKGNPVNELFKGTAPKAQLVICKVFTDDLDSEDLGGADTENILAALEDCVTLGVDVINMSLGTSAGFSSVEIEGDTEGEMLNATYRKIRDEGINLICAASNDFSAGYGSAFGTNLTSNPDSGTVGSPSTFDGALSVASINGQSSRYFTVEGGNGYTAEEPVFYTDSSDANYQRNDFLDQMIGKAEGSHEFRYVIVGGYGQASDYTSAIRNCFAAYNANTNPNGKKEGEKVIAVVKRGSNTFQQKVEIAMRAGADAIIIYNNVAGTISMSLGDIDNAIPAISVTKDAGAILTSVPRTGSVQIGKITLNPEYQAGPFMNDYSSWGATHDLKLKPEITSYGGEITSTVSGGYDEMSGTSMATPNLAGFAALVRSYLKGKGYTGTDLTKLVNNIIMSTATTVYNEDGLPYSPRKQGAGLATLENVFGTSAYLYTDESKTEGGRPKFELGEDENKTGVYNIKFYVKNYEGDAALKFKAKSTFMTESLSPKTTIADVPTVAERARLFGDEKAVWKVNGAEIEEGAEFTVNAGDAAIVEVTLKLSNAEKKYLNDNFENGMYVEGFLTLISATEGQCDLNLPFMGFYGDWEAAPMLDYDCYEIAEFEQDSSYTDETRPNAQVWATQLYSSYFGSRYVIPMGNYLYLQDENAQQVYTNREYAAISRFNEIVDEENGSGNHATTYALKALYAGLLRNAELVTYDLYNTDTGELITSDSVYRVSKAYAGGGTARPGQVLLEKTADELGLVANGRYSLEFHFYMDADDRQNTSENTFNAIFYVDYEAPVLESTSVRYRDYKENDIDKQSIYLDLDIYDNHYPQAVMLCYPNENGRDIVLATEYVTPIYNPVKNGTTTVSIEVTDFISEYKELYVQIQDYAMNYNVYQLSFSQSQETPLPDTFEFAEDPRVTVSGGEYNLTITKNEAYKIKLAYEGLANASNFKWRSSRQRVVKVQNGEVFGAEVGTAIITIEGKNNFSRKINVTVVDGNTKLISPDISFGPVKDSLDSLVKAEGSVKINAGSEFKLGYTVEPWYYPTDGLSFKWSSSNPDIAAVDDRGNVSVFDTEGIATIRLEMRSASGSLINAAQVMLDVQDPYTMSGGRLTAYHGTGGDIVLPDDKNIMTIDEEAFKDNDNITSIVIPSTVTQISARAFLRCTALESVYFVSKDKLPIAESDLTLISSNAFANCPNLKLVDLSNVKVITVDRGAFSGCTSLVEVKNMKNIGTMNRSAFEGCKSLLSADITGLHMSSTGVFRGCTSLQEVKTAFYTAIGPYMFYGCTALETVEINAPRVSDYAFANCSSLITVNFGKEGDSLTFGIGEYAFNGCADLARVNFHGNAVSRIGDMAFANCPKLNAFDLPLDNVTLGDQVFAGSGLSFGEAVYSGSTLVLAPTTITAEFSIREGTTEIAPYAFAHSTLAEGVNTVVIPGTVTKLGEGAFAHLPITSINIPTSVTEIPDYAFFGCHGLNSINIPANVAKIGTAAFGDCIYLTSVEFAGGSQLKSLGDEAFRNCRALERISLPDGCSEMGNFAFSDCVELINITLPSLQKLGRYTFRGCTSLENATFGANAATAGSYTFVACANLKRVTLGNNTVAIGAGVFNGCTSLTAIDLKNVTSVGEYAFTGDTALATVTGLERVEYFFVEAFSGCTLLTELNLAAAKEIGDFAFLSIGFTSLDIPVAEYIGARAFYGSGVSTVDIPATVKYIGDGAFTNSARLTAINVDKDNENYFSADGVVYRRITDAKTGEKYYELTAYPSAKRDSKYTVLEGVIQIQNRAFAEMRGAGFLKEITFTYSIKAIGAEAFYQSGVTTYIFECVEAPVLYVLPGESDYNTSNTMNSANFEDEFYIHTKDLGLPFNYPANVEPVKLTIVYPENGTGYDNFVYRNYFAEKKITAEIMDNVTREVKKAIEGFKTADEVSAWNTLAVNDENKAAVKAFADSVKATHAQYNNIKSQKQFEFLGQDNIDKLFAIERALKPVKERFGIATTVSALAVSADSTHKTAYKVGEKFDRTGLKIDVTYDDYSSETVDGTNAELVYMENTALTTLDRYVIAYVGGRMVQIAVTVTDDSGKPGPDPGNPGEPEDPKDPSFNPAFIYVPIICVVAAAGAAVAVILILKKKKSAKPADNGVENDAKED